jgi:hypothetical protein
MRWTGNVARLGKMRNAYSILVAKPGRKRPLGRLGIPGRIILEWILEKYGRKLWTGFVWLRTETSGSIL